MLQPESDLRMFRCVQASCTGQVPQCKCCWLCKARCGPHVVSMCAGNAEAQYLQGMGVARQRQAIVNGLRDSIKNFASDINDVSSRDVIEMVGRLPLRPVPLCVLLSAASCIVALRFANPSPCNTPDATSLKGKYCVLTGCVLGR